MSLSAMVAAWDCDAAHTVSERLVLLALADRADEHGVCWPGVGELMRKCRLSERTTRSVLGALRGRGVLVPLESLQGGRGKTTLYWIKLPGLDGSRNEADTRRHVKGADLAGKSNRKGATNDSERVQSTQLKGANLAGPYIEEPSENRQEPSETSSSSTAREGEVVAVQPSLDGTEEMAVTNGQPVSFEADKKKVTPGERRAAEAILKVFNDELDANFRSLAFLRKIVLRVREHPEVDLDRHREVIRFNLRNPWWNGAPNPSVIYGSASLFESLLTNAAKASPEDSMSFVERMNARRIEDEDD